MAPVTVIFATPEKPGTKRRNDGGEAELAQRLADILRVVLGVYQCRRILVGAVADHQRHTLLSMRNADAIQQQQTTNEAEAKRTPAS